MLWLKSLGCGLRMFSHWRMRAVDQTDWQTLWKWKERHQRERILTVPDANNNETKNEKERKSENLYANIAVDGLTNNASIASRGDRPRNSRRPKRKVNHDCWYYTFMTWWQSVSWRQWAWCATLRRGVSQLFLVFLWFCVLFACVCVWVLWMHIAHCKRCQSSLPIGIIFTS